MIRDSGSSPDKGSSWESYTYNRIVNRKLCFPSSGRTCVLRDQRALFSPRFARGLHPLPWNILRLKQVEYWRVGTLDTREGRCVSGFRRLGTETGPENGHSRLSDRNAVLEDWRNRAASRGTHESAGQLPVRNPDTVNMIYTAVSDTDMPMTTMTRAISARGYDFPVSSPLGTLEIYLPHCFIGIVKMSGN